MYRVVEYKHIIRSCSIYLQHNNTLLKLEMWANAQRDDHPAKYRWRPQFSATKTGCPLLEYRAVNLLACPKLANSCQTLLGGSSPYYEDMWRRYWCLTSFFRLSIHAFAKIWPDKVVRWCRDGDFLRPVFSASHVQHISDMHSKFALRPHHVWKYGRHPIADRWD